MRKLLKCVKSRPFRASKVYVTTEKACSLIFLLATVAQLNYASCHAVPASNAADSLGDTPLPWCHVLKWLEINSEIVLQRSVDRDGL